MKMKGHRIVKKRKRKHRKYPCFAGVFLDFLAWGVVKFLECAYIFAIIKFNAR